MSRVRVEQAIDDEQAEQIALAVQHLALVIRDEGLPAVRAAALEALTAAGGDPVAALCVAAALVPVDAPVDRWWLQQGPAQGEVLGEIDRLVRAGVSVDIARVIAGNAVQARKGAA